VTETEVNELLAKLRESRKLLIEAGLAEVESLGPGAARLLASEADDLRAELDGLCARTPAVIGRNPAAAPAAPADVRIALGPGEAPGVDFATARRYCRQGADELGRPVFAVHLTQDGRTAWISVPDGPGRQPRIHYPSYTGQSPAEAASHAQLITLAAMIADPTAIASLGYRPRNEQSFSLDERKAADLIERALRDDAPDQDLLLPPISHCWDPGEDDDTVQTLVAAAQNAGAITGPGIIEFYRTPEDGESPGYEWQIHAQADDGSEIRLTANGGELLYLGGGSRGGRAALAVLQEATAEANAIYGAARRVIAADNSLHRGPGAIPVMPWTEAGAVPWQNAVPEHDDPAGLEP
jgi:hypothetical protein